MKKIILDAGHGYNTPGKRTPSGVNGVVREWTMNANVCNYIAEILKDYDVEITRVDDVTGQTDVPVQTRTNKINSINPDLFISIHHNGNTGNWGNWSYVCAFYNVNKQKRDADLAAMLAAEISKQTGIKNSGGLPDTKSAVGSLHMVRETKSTIPSVLCEGGFMDSTIDYPIITSEKGQRAYAQAVANICVSYLGLTKTEDTTQGTKTVKITYDDIKITVDGKPTTLKNLEGQAIEPFLMDDTMYVPISPLVRQFGKTSTYDGKSKTLVIN